MEAASTSAWPLAGYAVAIAAASLAGGWLPSVVRMTHTRVQLAIALVAGVILGVALYHMLPHGLARLGPGGVEVAAWWMMLGMVFMLLLLRVFRFHQHDFSADAEGGASPAGAISIALGMGLHTVVEGVALGASVQAEQSAAVGSAAMLAGGGTFLAILLHKPLDALSITAALQAARLDRRWRVLANIGFALLCPGAALAVAFGLDALGATQSAFTGRALAFCAGAFVCIALADLLPEIHFHSHDRGKLSAAFLAGLALAYAMHAMESDAMHG